MRNRNAGAKLQYSREGGLSIPGSISSQMTSIHDTTFPVLDIAEVIDIIYDNSHPEFVSNEDIGKIKIRFLYDKKNNDEVFLSWATPMNANVVSYPLKTELVCIISFLGKYFYLGTLNFGSDINNNSMSGISLLPTKTNNSTDYNKTSTTGVPNKQSTNVELGETFGANTKIKPLSPKEGDIVISGRFGNHIRIGNNPQTNSPNIKMTVGQSIQNEKAERLERIEENINDNKSNLWITSDEIVNIKPATQEKSYYLKSAKGVSNKFDGNQILLSSDRLIFNSKANEIMLFSNRGLILNTSGYVAIDSSDDIGITTLGKLNIIASRGMFVDAREIMLGKSASEPLILGNKLFDILNELLDELIKETHPTGTGPSGPPLNQARYRIIKNKLRTILSRQNKTL